MVHKAHLVKSNSRHQVRNIVVAVKTIRGKNFFILILLEYQLHVGICFKESTPSVLTQLYSSFLTLYH